MPNALAQGSFSMRWRSVGAIARASLTVAQHNSRWQRGCYFDIGMSRLGATMILLALMVSACATTRGVSSPPQPAAVPRSAVQPAASPAMTLGPEQRVVAYPNGRWLLYGDGTVAAPYAWVWIPAGAPPPPSSPPAR